MQTLWTRGARSARARSSVRRRSAVPRPRPRSSGCTQPSTSYASRRSAAANAAGRPFRSTSQLSVSRSKSRHQSSRSSALTSDSPLAARSSSATAAASPVVAARTVKPSGRNELIEGVREVPEVGELARRPRLAGLAEAVDPDRAQAELRRRGDVVEMALRDVHVATALGAVFREEPLPVAVARLVRADLA